MANEIQFNASLVVAREGLSIQGLASKTVDMAGDAAVACVQAVGTTTEAIGMADVATPGYLFLKNEDATNFILIGLATPVTAGDAFLTLLPGEFAFVPTRQTTIYAKADTASVNLQVVLTEL